MGRHYPLLITPQRLPGSLETKGGTEEAIGSLFSPGWGGGGKQDRVWLWPWPAACQTKACVLLYQVPVSETPLALSRCLYIPYPSNCFLIPLKVSWL